MQQTEGLHVISKDALDRAEKAGGKATTKPKLPEKRTPIPPPEAAQPAVSGELLQMLAKQQSLAQEQAAQLQALVNAILEMAGPVRLKVHRDMDSSSKTHLLITHLDVVPVEVRKLNS